MSKILDRYGEFIGNRPYLVIAVSILLYLMANVGSGLVSQSVTDFSDQIPDDVESIKGFMFIEDEFGSAGTTVLLVLEPDPDYPGSLEARDVRSPEIMNYMDLIAEKIRTIPQTSSVRSASDLLKVSNNGKIPQSTNEIISQIDFSKDGDSFYSSFISRDYSISIMRITYSVPSEGDSEKIVNELFGILDEVSLPDGIKATYTGGPVVNIILSSQIGPTFAITGIASFLGIFLVVVLLFYSIRYGISSLLAIVFGAAWAFGFIGFIGIGLTPQTSGSLSLILGIGIDFGIQVVSRFRQELRRLDPRKAIAKTMPNVIPPLTISAIAIYFGFQSLNFANLKFIGELGSIMSIGVIMSYLAAITIVPAVLVVLNTLSLKNLRRKR